MTTDITELAQNPTRYGTNSQGVFTNQTDGAYVSYLDFVALVEELEKAQQRNTELDSRTVKLPELCVGVVQGGHAVMVPYPAGHWFNKTAILEMLAAAGIKVEAE